MAFDAIHDHFLAAAHAADPWKTPRAWNWTADRCAMPGLFEPGRPNDFLITGWNKGVRNLLGTAPQFVESNPGSANYYKDDAFGDALFIDTQTEAGSLLRTSAAVSNNSEFTFIYFGQMPSSARSDSLASWRTDGGKLNLLLLKNGSNGLQLNGWNDSSTLSVVSTLSGLTYVDRPIICICRVSASGTNFYAGNGDGWEVKTSAAQTSALAAYFNVMAWDNNPVAAEGADGWFGYTSIIGRAITDGEVQALLRDPTAPIRPKYDLTALSVALEQTATGTSIAANLATRTRTTHAATISRAYNITANLATRTRTTHAATITGTRGVVGVGDYGGAYARKRAEIRALVRQENARIAEEEARKKAERLEAEAKQLRSRERKLKKASEKAQRAALRAEREFKAAQAAEARKTAEIAAQRAAEIRAREDEDAIAILLMV